MGYYLRFFSKDDIQLSRPFVQSIFDEFQKEHDLPDRLRLAAYPTEAEFRGCHIQLDDDTMLCDLDAWHSADLEEEVADFRADLTHVQPRRNARWVSDYLANCRSVVSIELFHNEEFLYLDIYQWVLMILQERYRGLIQADAEGFSNESGMHVTWQYRDRPGAPTRKMALLDQDGSWRCFVMDNADPTHRDAFKQGRIPDGAEMFDCD